MLFVYHWLHERQLSTLYHLPLLNTNMQKCQHIHVPLDCLIAKGLTLHLLAEFFIMMSQSNGQSNSCAILILWNTLFSWGSIFVVFLKLTGSLVCKFVDLSSWTKFWKWAYWTKLFHHDDLFAPCKCTIICTSKPLNNKYLNNIFSILPVCWKG